MGMRHEDEYVTRAVEMAIKIRKELTAHGLNDRTTEALVLPACVLAAGAMQADATLTVGTDQS